MCVFCIWRICRSKAEALKITVPNLAARDIGSYRDTQIARYLAARSGTQRFQRQMYFGTPTSRYHNNSNYLRQQVLAPDAFGDHSGVSRCLDGVRCQILLPRVALAATSCTKRRSVGLGEWISTFTLTYRCIYVFRATPCCQRHLWRRGVAPSVFKHISISVSRYHGNSKYLWQRVLAPRAFGDQSGVSRCLGGVRCQILLPEKSLAAALAPNVVLLG